MQTDSSRRRHSPSYARNHEPIARVLEEIFALRPQGSLLEIGAGTGQHAVSFAGQFRHIIWQPSDLADKLESIEAWRQHSGLSNVREVIELDVQREEQWPSERFDLWLSINTMHIMAWEAVEAMFARIEQNLQERGQLILYGPFRFADRELEPSNARFDAALKEQVAPHCGLRLFEDLDALAAAQGLSFQADYSMPANNHVLVWGGAS